MFNARRHRCTGENAHGVLAIGSGKDEWQRLLAGSVIDGAKLPGLRIKDLELLELRRHVSGERFDNAARVVVFEGERNRDLVIDGVRQVGAADDDLFAQAIIGDDGFVACRFSAGSLGGAQPESGLAVSLQLISVSGELQQSTG